MKILMTLAPLGIFSSNFVRYVFEHCPANGIQNGDEALPTTIITVTLRTLLGNMT